MLIVIFFSSFSLQQFSPPIDVAVITLPDIAPCR